MHPVLLLVLLIAALVGISWLKRVPAPQRKQLTNRLLIGAALVVLLLLLVTGRLHPLFALAGALLPLIPRVLGAISLAKNVKSALGQGAAPTPGQTSTVATRFLRMSLSHDTGEMEGEVLEGRFRGRRLDALTSDELIDLYDECRAQDEQSTAVLEAYLDRNADQNWRERTGTGDRNTGESGASGPMSREEACQILGLSADASREEITEAHRRLMQKLHPDRGGSTFLAAKINQAKDVLLES